MANMVQLGTRFSYLAVRTFIFQIVDSPLIVYVVQGIAISRIGLWSFDLCQVCPPRPLCFLDKIVVNIPRKVKELQLTLDAHPRRNRLTALQFSLQNLFDLFKYALTLAASTPARFKWTALVSWIAVFSGGVSYAVYLWQVRGHLLHLEWFKKAR